MADAASDRPGGHLSIDVPSLEGGLRFYERVFSFVESARTMPTMAVLDANNVKVCMHEKPAGSVSSKGGEDTRRYERHWMPVHIDFHVDDFDAALERVRAEGGTIENEYRDLGPKLAAFCADPFGNGFCIIGD